MKLQNDLKLALKPLCKLGDGVQGGRETQDLNIYLLYLLPLEFYF